MLVEWIRISFLNVLHILIRADSVCFNKIDYTKVRMLALSCISYGGYKLQPYPLQHLSKLLMMKVDLCTSFLFKRDVTSLCSTFQLIVVRKYSMFVFSYLIRASVFRNQMWKLLLLIVPLKHLMMELGKDLYPPSKQSQIKPQKSPRSTMN